MVLQQDCADFGLAPPELSNIGEVEDDLNKQQAREILHFLGLETLRRSSSHRFKFTKF